MNFLDRRDEIWLERTLDSRKRDTRIKQLSNGRLLVFWTMIFGCFGCVTTLGGSLIISILTKQSGGGEMSFLIGLICLSPCLNYFCMDQELRLLKLVDRLPVDNMPRTEPPVADAMPTDAAIRDAL